MIDEAGSRCMGVVRGLAWLLWAQGCLLAQVQPLAPTSDMFITVTGPLHYSSITIPSGVTVSFNLPPQVPAPFTPSVIRCDGDVVIDGSISVAGSLRWNAPWLYAAGTVYLGQGLDGYRCAGVMRQYPGPGLHAGTYGSVLPFSLEGGSPSGWLIWYSDSSCSVFSTFSSPGEGGGTIVLLAGGRIDVRGTVTAEGMTSSSGGSGGSILLRGHQGVTLYPGSHVTAAGGLGAIPATNGAPGYVRIDAFGAPPILQGTITPNPTVVELPFLRAQSPPRIGATWRLDLFAPENAPVFVAAALAPAANTPTPFGPLGLNLATAATLAVTAALPSHDPVATVPWSIPNAPPLVGTNLWIQGLAAPGNLPARLTNTLAATVQ